METLSELERLLVDSALDQSWVLSVLPETWESLGKGYGARAGLVVLQSPEDLSFYENASFGYGEDGFFYEFLTQKSPAWNEIFSHSEPSFFSSESYPIFLPKGFAVVFPLGTSAQPGGFLLLEWEEKPDFFLLFPFVLLAKWITHLGEKSSEKPLLLASTAPLFSLLFPQWKSSLELWKVAKILNIQGKNGSGKKSLAMHLHELFRPSQPFLWIESIPDNLGKWEKAIEDWIRQAQKGCLVFANPKSWSEGHQATLLPFLEDSSSEVQWIFTETFEGMGSYYPPFARKILENKITIPSLDSLPKPLFSEVVELVFQKLSLEQRRGHLRLSSQAKKYLMESVQPTTLGELKKLLNQGILQCKGEEISENDMGNAPSEDLSLPDWEDLNLRKGTRALEKQKVLLAMRLFQGNQIRMAKALGISRGSLQYKLRQFGISPE